MPAITVNNNGASLTLPYDTFGDASRPTLLLISAIGAQMIETWDDGACDRLADAGFFVVRVENRDSRADCESAPGYTLEDMARDALQVADAVRGATAPLHVMGCSMGGMIAQTMAIAHPDRVATLTSVSSALRPTLPAVTDLLKNPTVGLALYSVVGEPQPTNRADFVNSRLKFVQALNNNSTIFPIDEARVRQVAGWVFDRGPSRDGAKRQMDAISKSGSRHEALRELRVKSLVVHGDKDTMIPLAAGRQTAAAIPGAKFVRIAGMGHYLPRAVWPTVVETFANFAK